MTFPITERMYRLLDVFQENDLNISQISDKHNMDRATISRTKDHLSDRGLIEEDTQSAYSVYRTTPDGDRLIKTLREIVSDS